MYKERLYNNILESLKYKEISAFHNEEFIKLILQSRRVFGHIKINKNKQISYILYNTQDKSESGQNYSFMQILKTRIQSVITYINAPLDFFAVFYDGSIYYTEEILNYIKNIL